MAAQSLSTSPVITAPHNHAQCPTPQASTASNKHSTACNTLLFTPHPPVRHNLLPAQCECQDHLAWACAPATTCSLGKLLGTLALRARSRPLPGCRIRVTRGLPAPLSYRCEAGQQRLPPPACPPHLHCTGGGEGGRSGTAGSAGQGKMSTGEGRWRRQAAAKWRRRQQVARLCSQTCVGRLCEYADTLAPAKCCREDKVGAHYGNDKADENEGSPRRSAVLFSRIAAHLGCWLPADRAGTVCVQASGVAK